MRPTSMMSLSFLIAVAAIGPGLPGSAQAETAVAQNANLTVAVGGVRSAVGQIVIWLWNGPNGFPTVEASSFKRLEIDARKAVNGVVTVSFDVPPGIYGVTALHDENSNGKMDTNILGIPKEGIGTSNNATGHFGPPSFDQASLEVPESGRKITIALRY